MERKLVIIPTYNEKVNIADMIADGEIKLMVNTPHGHAARGDGHVLRLAAVRYGVTYATTIAAAQAFAAAMEVARDEGLGIVALQDLPQWDKGM